MQFIFLIFGLIGLITLTLTAPTTLNDLPYPVEVVQYSGSLGGYEVQLNGTVQEMYAQMEILHSDFDPDSPGLAPGIDEKTLTSRASLNKVSTNLTQLPTTEEMISPLLTMNLNRMVCSAALSLDSRGLMHKPGLSKTVSTISRVLVASISVANPAVVFLARTTPPFTFATM
jgi:hypothetical protein